MPTPPLMIRVDSALRDALAARSAPRDPGRAGGLSTTMRRDLERYYALLDRELAGLALSEREALLVAAALNGVLHEPWSMPLLAAGVADAIRLDGLAAERGVDGDALVTRLAALTPAQCYALVDAVERAWLCAPGGDVAELLRAVGLVRRDPTPPQATA